MCVRACVCIFFRLIRFLKLYIFMYWSWPNVSAQIKGIKTIPFFSSGCKTGENVIRICIYSVISCLKFAKIMH